MYFTCALPTLKRRKVYETQAANAPTMQKWEGIGKRRRVTEEVTRRGLRSSALSIYHPAEGEMYFLFYIYIYIFQLWLRQQLVLEAFVRPFGQQREKQRKTFVIRRTKDQGRKIEKYARVGKKLFHHHTLAMCNVEFVWRLS